MQRTPVTVRTLTAAAALLAWVAQPGATSSVPEASSAHRPPAPAAASPAHDPAPMPATLAAVSTPAAGTVRPSQDGERYGGARPWGETTGSVGKLVWQRADGITGMCSGAVVSSPNGSVVATAAHCLADPHGNVGPVTEAWFLPGHGPDSGDPDEWRETGWQARQFHLPAEWQPDQDLHAILPHDYAFVTVEPKDGQTLLAAHGGNDLVFAPVPAAPSVTAVGYPARPPHDGDTPYSCTGPTRVLDEAEAAPANVGGLLLESCDLTAGASGGPWLQGFDPTSGTGALVAVTSVGNGDGAVVGRPFPDSARALFAEAGNDTPQS